MHDYSEWLQDRTNELSKLDLIERLSDIETLIPRYEV